MLAESKRRRLLGERQAKIDSIADDVLAYANRPKLFGAIRGGKNVPRDREAALALLEAEYGYNDDLLSRLATAKAMHASDIKRLATIETAAAIAVEHGDGCITLALDLACLLSPCIEDVR